MNIADELKAAADRLADAGIPDARREAASLLEFVLQKPRSFVIAHPEYDLPPESLALYHEALGRREGREPFHYITGIREFYGLDIRVTPDVLIPRPETEMLVQRSIEFLGERSGARVLEIGVGSGCISVAILKFVPLAEVVGVDVSSPALKVARSNAETHGVLSRIDLLRSDVYSALDDQPFDLIVTNPPYIPVAELAGLEPEVRDFEPRTALTDGGNGLSIIEEVISRASEFLVSGGMLLMEIGHDQANTVEAMLDKGRWRSYRFLNDLQDIRRILEARL